MPGERCVDPLRLRVRLEGGGEDDARMYKYTQIYLYIYARFGAFFIILAYIVAVLDCVVLLYHVDQILCVCSSELDRGKVVPFSAS